MFPDYICQNFDILAVRNVRKNNFGFHSNRKTQGHKRQLNNLYFKYQVCQMKLRYLKTFLQFRLFFHPCDCQLQRLVCSKMSDYWTEKMKMCHFHQTQASALRSSQSMTPFCLFSHFIAYLTLILCCLVSLSWILEIALKFHQLIVIFLV